MNKGFIHVILLALLTVAAIVAIGYFILPKTLSKDLSKICTDSNGCPNEYCTIGCVGGGPNFGCAFGCVPKDCQEFSKETCPVGESCSLWTNNSGEQVCYYNHSANDIRECGEAGYYGQKYECCEGFVRRPGEVQKDGTCDMTKGGYQDQFPYCIACGNNICERDEDKCNCPEDCTN